ncbi:unnamed protein product [Candidatus Protochlamydia amoebophila UWE25]|uniref:Transposase DDE domain-containing protein n=1 Tax=Protochlamydia amoebophila (strain UWE25) TaxID=264201 RepID=A0A2P9H9W4_PARUW|nr:unnamed protein product [Candidatus Protochlamydia amoebophila UWE25]
MDKNASLLPTIFFEGNYTRLKDFKQVLRKRAIIETVNDQLKNISQIE